MSLILLDQLLSGACSLMVLAKVQTGRPSCASTFQASVCTVPANITLTKAGHLAELKIKGERSILLSQ